MGGGTEKTMRGRVSMKESNRAIERNIEIEIKKKRESRDGRIERERERERGGGVNIIAKYVEEIHKELCGYKKVEGFMQYERTNFQS